MKRFFLLFLFTLTSFFGSLRTSAQTVVDLHTGKISAKTKEDYNYQAREKWQLEQDSIAYIDCLTRAFNFLHTDSLQQAQNLFERALKLRPNAPGNNCVRHNIGRIYMARAQWKDAANLFGKILEQEPANILVREDRAACYIESEELKKALQDYDYLILQNPESEKYHTFRAVLLSRSGDAYEALDEIDTLLKLNEKNPEAYLIRSEIFLNIGSKGYARRDLDKAVSLGIPKDDVLDLYQKITDNH